MAQTVLASPFTAGVTALRLPSRRIGKGKLVIRVSDVSNTDRILLSTDPTNLASATNANGFLNAGEALEICGESITNASDVSIISSSGTPAIFWGVM